MQINETKTKFMKKDFTKDNTLALKGIAILMMMFHHCFRVTDLFKNYEVSFFPFNQNFVVQMSDTFKICVSIFAFITGYGLVLSLRKLSKKYDWTNKQIGKWTVNRIIKTLAGFWIIAIISYIVCQLIDGRTESIFFSKGLLYGILQMIINLFGLSSLFGLNNFNYTWWYMSLAVLFILSVPIFAKLFKKFGYTPVLLAVIAIPRIIGWDYDSNTYISFLTPLLFGMIFAEKNLMVRIANFKLHKNEYVNKIVKFVIETIIIIGLFILYSEVQDKLFWEISFGIIPVCLICYLYEFYLDLPIFKQIFSLLGKYSMDIFLIHTFLRSYYLKDFIYSQGNFIKIALVLLLLTLAISIILELFKKLIRYDNIINRFQNFIDNKIDDSKCLNNINK